MTFKVVFFLIFTQLLCGQSIEVSGIVKDENGPLPGANVIVKGTTIGTQTNFDGYFNIKVPDSSSTLIISFIGFVTKEIKIDRRLVEQEFILELDEVEMEEYVIRCFFLPRYINVNYFGGLKYSGYGASVEYYDPYVLNLPFIPSLMLGYQTNNKGNTQFYAELGLDNILYARPFSFGANLSHYDIRVIDLLSFESFNLDFNAVTNLIFNRATTITIGLGTSTIATNERDTTDFGYTLGMKQHLPLGFDFMFKATHWQSYWQTQMGAAYNYYDFNVFYRYNNIGNYTEYNIGIGYQFDF